MQIIPPRRAADCGRVSMLASVVDAREATLCLEGGVDVIDCKDPSRGALGAVTPEAARAIVETVGGRVPVSATIGDHPCEVGPIVEATLQAAATGVDYVKTGFLPGGDAAEVVRALGRLRGETGKAQIVGVLFADASPDFELVAEMAAAGFAGVVLDTANKSDGALPDVLAVDQLEHFVEIARAHEMFCGLAGSLRTRHIPALVRLAPDLIGFRGALCRENARTGSLDLRAVAEIRDAIAKAEKIETDLMMSKAEELAREERAS